MPDKPLWCGRLEQISRELGSLPDSWVDRAILERFLGIGRRRAQQILAPCVTRQIGRSGLARREAVLEHLRRLSAGEQQHYERRRQQRLAEYLDGLRQACLTQPRVLVEAPASVLSQKLEGLPAGVALASGQITLRFQTVTEALEKLLALAMAIGNDRERFEEAVTIGEGAGQGTNGRA
jgi:hypothetical protein